MGLTAAASPVTRSLSSSVHSPDDALVGAEAVGNTGVNSCITPGTNTAAVVAGTATTAELTAVVAANGDNSTRSDAEPARAAAAFGPNTGSCVVAMGRTGHTDG